MIHAKWRWPQTCHQLGTVATKWQASAPALEPTKWVRWLHNSCEVWWLTRHHSSTILYAYSQVDVADSHIRLSETWSEEPIVELSKSLEEQTNNCSLDTSRSQHRQCQGWSNPNSESSTSTRSGSTCWTRTNHAYDTGNHTIGTHKSTTWMTNSSDGFDWWDTRVRVPNHLSFRCIQGHNESWHLVHLQSLECTWSPRISESNPQRSDTLWEERSLGTSINVFSTKMGQGITGRMVPGLEVHDAHGTSLQVEVQTYNWCP